MIKKRYISDGKVCEVTFVLSSELQAGSAVLVGDFNNWDKDAQPMKQAKDGAWKAKVKLDAGREYQYRYFVNGSEWQNDMLADGYVVHPYGGENSVVIT
ncbi:MAG: isoamylase early set domain-containing protein [Anaerolineae bacterium]|nr:isoamylase early set domain-containing protein [Anaerolineae bacterium]